MQFIRQKTRSAVMPIILINIAAFVLQQIIPGFTENFMLLGKDVFVRSWIMVTSMFLHGGFNHLLFNMYALFLFGPLLESRIGYKRFIYIYFGSGILASFISSFFYQAALGASGAIMGMLGALIILMPHLKLLLFFIMPMPLWMAGILWAAIDTFGIFVPSGVGNIAHLVGMGTGLAYGLYLKKQKKQFNKRFASKTHMDMDDVEEYLRSGRI